MKWLNYPYDRPRPSVAEMGGNEPCEWDEEPEPGSALFAWLTAWWWPAFAVIALLAAFAAIEAWCR